MKKFLVIGNPIDHSLSPKLHNYWIKKNNIDAIYEKQKLEERDLKDLISQIKEKKIHGINVTVPFKKSVIPFVDELTLEAKKTKSVNTIYLENNKIFKANFLCEPQMGKRGLYPTLSTKESNLQVNLMMDFISLCDGEKSLLNIAELQKQNMASNTKVSKTK